MSNDQPTRQELILKYYPMVRQIAYRMIKKFPAHVDAEDLVHIGLLGLINAIDRYNAERTPSFSTYARIRVQGSILDEMRHNDWVPRSVRDRSNQIKSANEVLKKKLGRKAEFSEIAAYLNVSQERLQKMYQRSDVRVILSFEDGSDKEQRLGDTIPDKASDPHTDILRRQQAELLRDVVEHLSLREQQIIQMYYYKDLTFKQIADLLGVTESRVSQVHSSIKKKMRILAEKKNLNT